MLMVSSCGTLSISNLLTPGSAVSVRQCNSAGIQVHDAAGRAAPEEGVIIICACRTIITISNLLAAGNALSVGLRKSVRIQVHKAAGSARPQESVKIPG